MNKSPLAFLIIISLLYLSAYPFSEDWKILKSLPVAELEQISSDPYHNFYLSDTRGNIFKYDSSGNNIGMYSSKRLGSVSLLEANRNVNIFAFYRNNQEVKYYNRFLNELSSLQLNRLDVGYARIACPSADNNLWVIDDDDLTLKKINLAFNRTEINTSLTLLKVNTEKDFQYIREFENHLYLLEKHSGIYVFDNLGNYKTKIEVKNLKYFSFLKEWIYFLEGNSLVMINLKSGLQISKTIPPNNEAKAVLLTSDKAYFFGKKTVYIYKFSLPD